MSILVIRRLMPIDGSDGRVDSASASGPVDLSFYFDSGQANSIKIGIHSYPA